jgi:hypothetical protein
LKTQNTKKMRTRFKKLETISGRQIFVRPNFSKKVFTIKTDAAIYRTYKLPVYEFDENLFNTGNDWQNFLGSTQNYFPIK